jgi:uncharacterized protein (TIGR04255 family)
MDDEKSIFPKDIILDSNPLVEAWLEIKWKLTESFDQKVDEGYRFALGNFYNLVKQEFPHIEKLPASQAPEDLFPYLIQYRFRSGENQYPLFQLGPGIAAINYTDTYTWEKFKPQALKLCEYLIDAYGGRLLESESFTLRYRNAINYHKSEDILSILQSELNLDIKLPQNIADTFSSGNKLRSLNLNFNFDLGKPNSEATVKFITGTRKEDKETRISDLILWQLEYQSTATDVPPIKDLSVVEVWLESAHSLLYQWFFSIIKGQLFSKFKGE